MKPFVFTALIHVDNRPLLTGFFLGSENEETATGYGVCHLKKEHGPNIIIINCRADEIPQNFISQFTAAASE